MLSQHHVNALLRTIPDLIWLKDPTGVYLACNARFEEFCGVDESDLIGRTDYDFTSESQADSFRLHDLKAVAMKGPLSNDEWLTFVRGGYHGLFETIKTPFYDEQGTLLGVVGISRDITVQRRNRDKLQESEERYQSLLTNTPAILYRYSTRRGGLYYSAHVVHYLGYTPDELLAEPQCWHDSIHPDDLPRIDGVLANLATTNGFDFEYRIRHRHGNWLWFQDRCITLLPGEDEIIFDGIAEDITRRKEAELQLEEERRGLVSRVAERTTELTAANELLAQKSAERERLLDALQESEQRFRSYFELGLVGMSIISTEGILLQANYYLCTLLGYGREELLKMTLQEVTHPEDQAESSAQFGRMLRCEINSYSIDQRYIRKDGTIVHAQFSSTSLRRSRGGVNYCVAMIQDISKRVADEAQILKANHEWRSTFDTMPDLIAIIDTDYRITRVNRAMADALNKTEQEAVGLSCYELIHGTHAPPFEFCAHKQLLADGQPQTIELCGSNLKGWFQVDVAPLRDENGSLIGSVHVAHDITTLKQNENELRRSEHKYRQLHESMTEAFVKIDMTGRIVESNLAYRDLVGYSAEEIVNLTNRELTPDKWHELEVRLTRDQILPMGFSDVYEKEYICKDGTLLPVELRAYLLRDNDGRPEAMWALVRDISKRQQAEEHILEINQQLSIARQHADAANHAKSTFLANMSHEIRTPLNAIIGLGHLALQTDLTSRQRDYLDKITTSSEILLKLLNDLLDFSKIEAGKLELEETDFPLRPVLERLMSLIEVGATAKGLTLRLTTHPEIPEYLKGDSFRLEQILFNLLGNAVKFTSSGEVELMVRLLPTVSEQTDKLIMEFAVRDTGIGLTPDLTEHIFKAFSQADGSITRVFGGTGLGLNICQQLVSLMGGEIKAMSTPGMGSTFTFTAHFLLGSASVAIKKPLLDRSAVITALSGSRMLVVDDQSMNRQVFQELLEQMGVQVTVAGNGREALNVVEREEGAFDAVLMDLQMPELDGYETTRLLRREWSDRFPIIALTAHVGSEERERCLEAGMDDHLAKPIDPDQFYQCLLRWLRSDLPREAPSSGISSGSSPSTLPDSPPGLDMAAGLTVFGGNAALYRTWLINFGSSQGDRMAELGADLVAGNLEEAGKKAHALKGIAGNIGAGGIYVLAGDLEMACYGKDVAAARQLLSPLRERMAEVAESAVLLAALSHEGRSAPRSFDTAAALALAHELAPLVQEHNLAARKVCRQLSNILMGTELEESVDKLAENVLKINFQTAALSLEELTHLIESREM